MRVLRELGDHGSVTAVAEVLFVTPSAVSQQLRALQRTMPTPLTERVGRRVQLTPAGRALAEAAADVEFALARARQTVSDFVGDPAGEVSLAAFHSAAAAFFPTLPARLAHDDDAPRLQLSDEDVAQHDFPALTGTYDLVIAHRMDHAPRWPRSVAVASLLHEPLDVALPAGHPLTHKTQLTARDVAGESWISVHDGFPLSATLDAIGTAARRPLQVVHRINDFTVALRVVAAGGVVALAPRWTAIAPAGVDLRPLRGVRTRRRIDVLYRRERLTRRSVRDVLDALHAVAAEIRAAR